jgi:hypothetical protein
VSVEASAWAWRQKLPAARKVVLLALADHSDKAGVSWPSLETLQEKCGVGRASVYRALADFKEADWLIEEGGKWILTRIDERLPERRSVSERDAPSQSETRTRTKEPSIEPSEEPGLLPDPVESIFDFWRSTFSLNGNTKLTAGRRRAVKARLREGYSAERIHRAILGCAGSDFHVKGGHTDLTLICRSGEKVEAFEAKPPPAAAAAPSEYDRPQN